MNSNRETYLKLFDAGKQCQHVFAKQTLEKLEPTINSIFSAYTDSLSKFPLLTGIIANVRDENYDYLTNLIVKQVITTYQISAKLDYEPSAIKSNVVASLFILYALTPSIIQAKKLESEKQALQRQFNKVAELAFTVAKKIKITDHDSFKILSQIARKNKYYNTNQLCQSAVLLSINVSLRANLGLFNALESFVEATSQQFTYSRYGSLDNPFFSNHAITFNRLVNSDLLIGSICVNRVNEKFLVIEALPTVNDNDWLCIPIIKAKTNEFVELSNQDISHFIAQPKLDLSAFITRFGFKSLDLDTQLQKMTSHQIKSANAALKYQPPVEWQNLAALLRLDDPIKLVKRLSNSMYIDQHKSTLLNYATSINRENREVTDLKHAVNLLGTSRLLPVVVIAALSVQHNAYKYSGYTIVNNKINLFSEIVQSLAKTYHRPIPEYLGAVARLIFLGLITIPKARFAATSHNPHDKQKASVINRKKISLATIYNISDVKTWGKISTELAKRWYLPKHQLSLIVAYFEQLALAAPNKNIEPTPSQLKRIKFHQNEIKILEQASQVFAELTEIGQVNPSNKEESGRTQNGVKLTHSIDDVLQAEKLDSEIYPIISNKYLFTPLS